VNQDARADAALIRRYAESPELRSRLYRRTLRIVVASQVCGGAGLAAGITVGALLAADMLGTNGLAGIPTALFTLGSAGSALAVGRLSQRLGRRVGLTAGFLAGAIGAAGVVVAAVLGSIVGLFVSLLIYGSGFATNLQARYAGTDLASPSQRGTAVSIALVSTTLGAVAGPNLVTAMGEVAVGLGIPALAGPFLLAALAFGLAGTVLFAFLRPDPFMIARGLAAMEADARPAAGEGPRGTGAAAGEPADGGSGPGLFVGATVMVLTMIAMVAIMTMTPVHMRQHGHGLADVGLVIGVHVGAMFLPSLVTGALVDKVGRLPMAAASAVTLMAAGLVAALSPTDSMAGLLAALALLGLGWNFGLISGTALIVDATPAATRARTQGSVDVLVSLAGAGGGALSGLVVAGSNYAALALGGGALALLLVPVVVWSRRAPAASAAT
jgi:MFS family permease